MDVELAAPSLPLVLLTSMRIRTAEKRSQTHKICAFLRMQLCLIPTNLIGKAVINPALFTVGMETAARGFLFIIRK